MKKGLFWRAICLLMLPALHTCAQNTPADSSAPAPMVVDRNIQVFDNVLKMADWAGLDYKTALERAKSGDGAAVRQLLEFHKAVDGVDALNHSVTCLELIPVAGDNVFGGAVALCSPNLRKQLSERLILAQGRTKKTALRQSLTNWAPITWGYLTDKPIATMVSDKPKEAATKTSAGSAVSPGAAPVRDTISGGRRQ